MVQSIAPRDQGFSPNAARSAHADEIRAYARTAAAKRGEERAPPQSTTVS